MDNRKKARALRAFGLMTLLCFVFSSSGCEPFRKKFTRKKKEEKVEEFIPVLDPIDYPASVRSPEQDYRRVYGLWKVWQKELLQEMESGESQKRQAYLFQEVMTQLNEMKKLLKEDKKKELEPLIKSYDAVRQEYDSPSIMRRSTTLKRQVERNGQAIVNNFNPKEVSESIISL